jgi:hypothetical protein
LGRDGDGAALARAAILVERSRIVVLFGALFAPFLGGWIGARVGRTLRAPSASSGAFALGLGATAGTLVAPVLLFVAMCSPPPGRGAASEAWYRRAQPAIDALQNYHENLRHYPASLSALTPHYLSTSALAELRSGADDPIRYKADSVGYELTFHYYGPGSNSCTYRSTASAWQCRGLF